jgi:hypothetical protein
MKSLLLEKRVVKTRVLIHKSGERIKHLKKRLVDAAKKYKEAVDKERIIVADRRKIK